MQGIDLWSYHEFFQETLKVQNLFAALRDQRKKPEIPAWVIARAIVYALSAGQKSFLGMDNLLHASDLGKVLGFERFPVCSDSLMAQVLKTVPPQQIREILYAVAEVLIRLGLAKGAGGGLSAAACAIDGTTMLGRDVVACYWVGCEPYVALDWEPVLKGENEVEAAKRLLPRVLQKFGWAIQVVVGDGLYTGWFFKICMKHGKQAVAKLREEDARDLKIVQAARQRLQEQRQYRVPAEPEGDEDPERSYELREVGTWEAFELPQPVRVVWSLQNELKGQKRHDEHWLLTTLSPEQASGLIVRRLGRFRWRIENNGFREMNQKMGRKHRYSKDENVASVMMGLMMVAQSGVQGYLFTRRQEVPQRGTSKRTVDFIMKLLFTSLLALKPPPPPEQDSAQPMLFSERTMRRLGRRPRPAATG